LKCLINLGLRCHVDDATSVEVDTRLSHLLLSRLNLISRGIQGQVERLKADMLQANPLGHGQGLIQGEET